jgi:hypothetical protein
MTPADKQVEAERLRHARALIEDILREADVCASVVLAGRGGRGENFAFLNASWSVVRLNQTPHGDEVRIKSKLSDYDGNVELQREHQAWSAGAMANLGMETGRMSLFLLQMAKVVDTATGAVHTELPRDDPRDAR